MALAPLAIPMRRRTIAITLSQFIHFETSDGNGKVAAVNEIRTQPEWNAATDFYLPLRQRIRRGVADEDLSAAQVIELADQVEPAKQARYSAAARGYGQFQRSYRPRIAGSIEATIWTDGELRVKADPEAIFRIDDRRYITKIYLRKDPLAPARVVASLQLLRESYARPGHRVAILDCARGRIYRDTRLNQQSRILLRTTAAQFVGMWRALEQGIRVTEFPEIS